METRIATAMSKGSVEEAAETLTRAVVEQLGGAQPSTAQPLGDLLPALKRRLGAATLLGASTAGEFTERGDAKGSVTLFAVAGEFKVFAGMATGLKADPEAAVAQAAAALPATVEGLP